MNRVAQFRLALRKVPISRHFGLTSIKFTAATETTTFDRHIVAKPKYADATPNDEFMPRMSWTTGSDRVRRHRALGKAFLSFYNALAASVGYCCSPGAFSIADMGLTMAGVHCCAMSAAALNIGMFVTFLYQLLQSTVTNIFKRRSLLMMHIWISRGHDRQLLEK